MLNTSWEFTAQSNQDVENTAENHEWETESKPEQSWELTALIEASRSCELSAVPQKTGIQVKLVKLYNYTHTHMQMKKKKNKKKI